MVRLREFSERRPRGAEVLVCLALFVATTAFSAWFLIQHVPSIGYAYRFSTVHFVPAALWASGAEYVNPPADQVAGMRDFLDERADTFVWQGDVPEMEDAGLTWFHRGSAYLLWTVALAWKVFGVSWVVFRCVIAVMAGVLAVVCYGLGRLFAPRWASALTALLFMTTPAVLTVMPNIRDFAKAPFILGAFGVMLWLVMRPMRPRALLGVAAGLGAMIGMGIGFRPDVLVCLPPAVVMVALTRFEDGERRWPVRVAAPLLVLAAFFLASAPMRFAEGGDDAGGVAHDIVTGMSTESEQFLGVHSPNYERVYYFWDGFTHAIGNSYGRRVMGMEGPIPYQSEAADEALTRYMLHTMAHFPGDMLARGYASALRILGSGFARVEEYRQGYTLYGYPNNGVIDRLAWVWYPAAWLAEGWKIVLVIGGLFAIGCLHGRAWAAAFMLGMYFTGYASLQFHLRHYFHLTFFTLLLVLVIGVGIARYLRERPPEKQRKRAVALGAAGLLAALILIYAPLEALRLVQGWQVARVRAVAREAELEPLAFKCEDMGCVLEEPIQSPKATEGDQLWEVQTEYVVLEFEPTDKPRDLILHYHAETDFNNFSHKVVLPRSGLSRQRYYVPVYQSLYHSVAGEPNPSPGFDGRWGRAEFSGVLMPPYHGDILVGMYRVVDLEPFPLLYNFSDADGSNYSDYYQTIELWSWP